MFDMGMHLCCFRGRFDNVISLYYRENISSRDVPVILKRIFTDSKCVYEEMVVWNLASPWNDSSILVLLTHVQYTYSKSGSNLITVLNKRIIEEHYNSSNLYDLSIFINYINLIYLSLNYNCRLLYGPPTWC